MAERLRADCAKRGELWMRAWGDFFVALAGIGLGRPDDALVSARQALAAKWRVHDRLGAAAVADLLVAAEASRGEPERAARLLGAGTRLWHAAGLPSSATAGRPSSAGSTHATSARPSATPSSPKRCARDGS